MQSNIEEAEWEEVEEAMEEQQWKLVGVVIMEWEGFREHM